MSRKSTLNLLNNIDILILCGGLGTRLRPVISDRPKPMAELGKKPFLALVVKELLRQGFRRIIFCTGHMGEHIERYFKKSRYAQEAEFVFSKEESPLDTGGAVKLALPCVKSKHFFVINGDTFPKLDFQKFYENYLKKQPPLSLALAEKNGRADCGNVTLARSGEMTAFAEKNKEKTDSFVNAGCYVMNKKIAKYFPDNEKFSLERDVFPRLAGRATGFIFDGKFLDIGTPERYASAHEFFS
ncbi:MAG: nucleotidyltransferase family protein [Candidatus Liptonbacteria bacterium]|nr:nucleotidyltransferase family protein [Candidatus Liptonbacteria bacterium]